MTCAVCGTRKAKRACPGIGRSICPTCCGTKRLKEIACPADCVYLAAAQAHPPAVVQRQRERDLPLIVRMIEGFTDAQVDVLSRLETRVRAHRALAIPPIRDADLEEAVRTMAATLETASRGILYEHQTTSIPAQRLQQDLRVLLTEPGEQDRAPGGSAVALVLRRVEQMVQQLQRQPDASDTAFLDLLDRIARARESQRPPGARPSGSGPDEPSPSRIILPY
jgi:hypothetical protein